MANHVLYDSIWESDKLAECSLTAAMAYPWIFLVADAHGRFEYKPRMVWKHVFSYRQDVSVEDVAGWLDEYWRVGLLIRYHIDGDLAHWYKFKGRKPSDRRPSEYPDPSPDTIVRANVAVPPPRRGGDVAVPPRQTRARDRSDQIRSDQRTTDPVATAPALEPPPFDPPEYEQPLGETTAPAVVPLPASVPWNSSAAELWWHEYQGDPPKAFFGALKPLVKRVGWDRVRPALVTYLAETPAEYANISGKFVAAFGTWESRARGAPRLPPGKQTAGEKSLAAAERFIRRGGDSDRPESIREGAHEIGDGLSPALGRRDP